ncbi:MAG: hypothetical protein HRT61_03500 [Ekhidna sp.]|nr:hypothetical protein [Ekhidna sp.]
MLRLLNQFKRKQLKEGKIKSFLLYTVGEVFLVVIGILIALQIDNWNREKVEQEELKEYLIKVANNVSEDIVLASSNLQRRKELSEISKSTLLKIIMNGKMELSDIYRSNEIFVDFQFIPKKSGMESLTNAGFINELNQSGLDSLLFEYYLIVEDLDREERSFNGFIESMEAKAYAQNNFLPLYKEFLGVEPNTDELQMTVQKYFSSNSVQSSLMRSSGQLAILRLYEKLIKTEQLLREEINSKVKTE